MKNLTATICLTIAVLLGSAGVSWSADFKKGVAAYESGDFATALREWTPLAEQGSATAQFNLGKLHQRGLGIPKDAKRAMYWFGLAASQGEASAMYEIGLIFDKGEGIEKNPIKAKEWFEAAANTNTGHAKSELNLGNFYGRGIRDQEGNELLSRDWSKAKKWWGLSATKGVSRAQFNIGILYSKGITVPKDKVKSLMWFLISLEENNVFESDDRERSRSAVSKMKIKMFDFEINQAQKFARECIRKKYKECAVTETAAKDMDGNKAQTIIQTYGSIQMATTDYLVADVRRLPFPKSEIKKAIIFVRPLVDKRMCEYLRAGYMQLAKFQPARKIRMLKLPRKISSLSNEKIFSYAKKIEVELDKDWFVIIRFVIDRMKSLLSEIPKC